MESGRSALKITTASYFRPSGVNIHRFPDSKKEDDWGVKPDEGHLVELNKEQWQEWVKAREMVDIHHGHPADPATPPYAELSLESTQDDGRNGYASGAIVEFQPPILTPPGVSAHRSALSFPTGFTAVVYGPLHHASHT